MKLLITGAAKRVGRHLTESLASQGHDVILHCNESLPEARALAKQLTEKYPRQNFPVYQQNLCELETVDGFIARVASDHENIDVLINNAAMFDYDLPFDFETSKLLEHITINSVAPMALTRDFIKYAKGEAPIIINILDSKIGALNPDYFSYTIGKMALYTFTQLCAMNVTGKEKIYGIAPSMLLWSGEPTEGRVEELTKVNLLKEPIPLDAICKTLEFLIQGVVANGEIIFVDGGQNLMGLKRDVAFLDERP